MRIGPLEFRTIDLKKDSATAIKFREDSFVVSFGTADRFYEADRQGHVRYLQFLKERIELNPEFAVHVWQDFQIVGQIELGLLKGDSAIGYVNLYYLRPENRGIGISRFLDEYVMQVFRGLNKTKLRLSVSPTNKLALRFYQKMGWIDLGPRPDQPEVHFMEKEI